MVAQVRGGSKRKKLRHVEPVEKRAFRIGKHSGTACSFIYLCLMMMTGRVVGGSSNEAALYSTQNQIVTFNKKWLLHVALKEPGPAFPIGRMCNNCVLTSGTNVHTNRFCGHRGVEFS